MSGTVDDPGALPGGDRPDDDSHVGVFDEPDDPSGDGRHARRQRNRAAVLATTVELLRDGDAFPTLQDIAERAGVSLRSVHRYFEDADEAVVAMMGTYMARQMTGLDFVPQPGGRPLEERITHWVTFRVRAQRVARLATVSAIARANRSPRVAGAVEAVRQQAIDAIAQLFAPELDRLGDDDRRATLALVHAATQIESWDNLVNRHGLDDPALRDTWTRMLTAAFSAAS